MGALRKRFGALRPEKGNVIGWPSSSISVLPSPVRREWPRPGMSGAVPLLGLEGGSGVELVALSYSIVAVNQTSQGLEGTNYTGIDRLKKEKIRASRCKIEQFRDREWPRLFSIDYHNWR